MMHTVTEEQMETNSVLSSSPGMREAVAARDESRVAAYKRLTEMFQLESSWQLEALIGETRHIAQHVS